MIIVLQEQSSSDTIVFSSVTSFDEGYSGTVTSHPVEDGSTIVDHFFTDNDKFKISSVVTDYDFLNPLNQVGYGVLGYEDNLVANQSLVSFKNGVLVGGTGTIPANKTQNAIKSRLIDIHKRGQFVTILMYQTPVDGFTPALIGSKFNCIITSLSFKEDADSGYAVYPEISLERVRLAKVGVEAIAKGTIPSIQTVKDKLATKLVKSVGNECAKQMITEGFGEENAIKTVVTPKVPKGTTINLCNPTKEDKDIAKSLTYFEQRNAYLEDLSSINIEIENINNQLRNLVEGGQKESARFKQLESEKGYLQTAYKALSGRDI